MYLKNWSGTFTNPQNHWENSPIPAPSSKRLEMTWTRTLIPHIHFPFSQKDANEEVDGDVGFVLAPGSGRFTSPKATTSKFSTSKSKEAVVQKRQADADRKEALKEMSK